MTVLRNYQYLIKPLNIVDKNKIRETIKLLLLESSLPVSFPELAERSNAAAYEAVGGNATWVRIPSSPQRALQIGSLILSEVPF